MLIDAAHPEETRVAVLSGSRLEDFDVESEARKQIKGNIYLAKVIRVEPSLQAAFVDYGGNRHGFLAFSEIHPDYYQIPIEDRQALLAEHDAAEKEDGSAEDAEADAEAEAKNAKSKGNGEDPDSLSEDNGNNDKNVEVLGGDDSDDVKPKRHAPSYRKYKIQEVVKRRQIMLIQVVKEERGNKGAALTTYISLAGRYCVLMPNTARGGGISRKITNSADRKQLKGILSGLKIPDGMAVIVRTAGIKRTKAEIKRDYEYLLRLWDNIRELTLESTAPTLVHEEGNLIKRSIRDLYSRDIEEIVVDGDDGYRMAKNFIKLLIPSHAKRVQPYKEKSTPIFQNYQVESQLDAIHSTDVQLRSGGYIVINPTEALVSIDVNSGRSTRERNIEETAFKTNLEAADEIARQLRLRDLAGLIVIDFIDMEVSRNNVQVERRLKDAMRNDRARIQIGRISPFGLLELSRQRLRMSLIETSSEPCPYCDGTGIRRSTDAAALVALRAVEEEANRKKATDLIVHVPTAVALYILNQKRSALAEIETKYEVSVIVTADESLIPPNLRIERIKGDSREEVVRETPNDTQQAEDKPSKRRRRSRRRKSSDSESDSVNQAETTAETSEAGASTPAETVSEDEAADGKGGKRRRRGKRGGRRRRGKPSDQVETGAENQESQPDEGAPIEATEVTETAEEVQTAPDSSDTAVEATEEKTESTPRRRRSSTKGPARSRGRKPKDEISPAAEITADPASEETSPASEEEKPAVEEKSKRRPRKRKSDVIVIESVQETVQSAPDLSPAEPPAEPTEAEKLAAAEAARTTVINIGDKIVAEEEKPKRGWWRR